MDEQSYLEQVAACERSLYRVARSMLWDDMDCADAVQQAVFNGWINRGRLRNPQKFRAWLTRILVNECRNVQRRRFRQKRVVAEVENRMRSGDGAMRTDDMREAIEALPEHYRLPVLLHYMEGYSVRETAEILKITEKRASERLYRARRKLEEALKQ